jgi:hypothetical protein
VTTTTKTRWPFIGAIGLQVSDANVPYVTWARIRRGLGSWRYSLGLRIGTRTFPAYGMPADDLEDALAKIADDCKNTWPANWRPAVPQ